MPGKFSSCTVALRVDILTENWKIQSIPLYRPLSNFDSPRLLAWHLRYSISSEEIIAWNCPTTGLLSTKSLYAKAQATMQSAEYAQRSMSYHPESSEIDRVRVIDIVLESFSL